MTLLLAFIAVFLILWGLIYATLPALRHAGAFAARAIARLSLRYARIGELTKRMGPYLPIAAVFIAGGLLTAWAGDAFLDLAEQVHQKSAQLQDLDTFAHAWAISAGRPEQHRFFNG